MAFLAPTPLRFATALVLTSASALLLWSAQRYDPAMGEPVVHLQIEPLATPETASIAPLAPDDVPAGRADEEVEDGAIDLFAVPAPGEELETTETRTALIVAPRIKLTPAPAKGYFENAADGLLPKLSSSGRRPFDIYARPVHKGVLQSDQPKIAILLGGMGINAGLTARASRELPGEVTFAFAPYGNDLQKAINEVRSRGHEVMLQLPMEPFGYPEQDPGPHTLRVAAGTKATGASLSWLLSRFAGYTGVVNYLGARFTSDGSALAPVMQTLKERGLVYLDDGSSPRSVAEELAGSIELPTRRADVIIDGEASFNAITAKLQELEKLSREGRIVIGVGSGLPATIDAVEAWAKRIESRGILLVPVSAAFRSRPG